MPGSWGREIGGMLQGTGTAGRSFKRRPGLIMGCCADDDDDDDDDDDSLFLAYFSLRIEHMSKLCTIRWYCVKYNAPISNAEIMLLRELHLL
jgi:hypothetical protein